MPASPLFENAVDSLDLAIHFQLHSQRSTAQKHAVLNSFHAVELFLKERLHQENPLLIFENVGGKIDDDARTVGVKGAYARLRNAGVELDERDWKDLQSLQRYRNRIEHRHFNQNQAHKDLTDKAFSFILRFVRDHLAEDLTERLGERVYAEVSDRVLTYEQRLADAYQNLKGTEPNAWCPECGEYLVVVEEDGEQNAKCYFCLATTDLHECPTCGEYVTLEDFREAKAYGRAMCSSCLRVDIERWNESP